MRLPTLDADGWELRSADAAHAQNPTTFWIPSLEHRKALQPGQAVKLLFDIRVPGDDDGMEPSGERMWIVVSNRIGNRYIGRLVTQPASLEDHEDHYLQVGAVIPFGVEHVTDIDDPPEGYARSILATPPTRYWSTDTRR